MFQQGSRCVLAGAHNICDQATRLKSGQEAIPRSFFSDLFSCLFNSCARAIFHVPGRGSLPGVFEPRSPAATSCSLVRSIADTPTWQAPRARGSSFGRFDANDRVDWMSRKRGRGWRAHSRTSLEETLEHTPAPGSYRLPEKRPYYIVCL